MCLPLQTDSFKVDQELTHHEDSLECLLSLSGKDRLSMDSVIKSEVDAELGHVLLTEKGSENGKTEDSVQPFVSSVNSPGTNLEYPMR